jgi:hypothetical protein
MIFADLQAGETIFLDANPVVYHVGPYVLPLAESLVLG